MRNSIAEALAQMGGSGTNASAGQNNGKATGETTLNFDASFFEQLALLIRNDVMNKQRGMLAFQYNQAGIEVAQLASELEYYTNLKKQLSKVNSQKIDSNVFVNQFQNAVNSMIQTAKQIEQFKALILDCEASGAQFYRPSGPTSIMKSAAISGTILAGTMLVLWILINFCAVLIASLPAFHAEKK